MDLMNSPEKLVTIFYLQYLPPSPYPQAVVFQNFVFRGAALLSLILFSECGVFLILSVVQVEA